MKKLLLILAALTAFLLLAASAALLLLFSCGVGYGGGATAYAPRQYFQYAPASEGASLLRESLGLDPGGWAGFGSTESTADLAEPMAASAPAAPAPAAAKADAGAETAAATTAAATLDTADRKVISTASISLEVDAVQDAAAQARVIAESLGGFVEQMSLSGSDEDRRASITLRVPQDQFRPALGRLEALGKLRDQNLGSEDVSELFIDLEAQHKSALRKEQSLLSLLEKATNVSEILSIERELARVRSDIERLQGRLNFLERRVDLATIRVSLFPPPPEFTEPPTADLNIRVSNVTASVDRVKEFVARVDGSLDRVSLSVRDDRELVSLSFRVFPADFAQALELVEAQGALRDKYVEEGVASDDPEAAPPEKPNARVEVSFRREEGPEPWAIAGIAIGVTLVLLLFLAALRFVYRAGRRSA